MKNIFTLIVMSICSLSMMATDYTGTIGITINGQGPLNLENKQISVTEESNGTYTLLLENFILEDTEDPENSMPIGTIKVEGVKATTENEVTTLSYNDKSTIQPMETGDPENQGYLAGEDVDLKITGTIKGNKFNTTINIPFGDMNIDVTFEGTTVAAGIHSTTTINKSNGVQAIYNLAGQQVCSMTSGNVYIVKTTDGKTKKVIKK